MQFSHFTCLRSHIPKVASIKWCSGILLMGSYSAFLTKYSNTLGDQWPPCLVSKHTVDIMHIIPKPDPPSNGRAMAEQWPLCRLTTVRCVIGPVFKGVMLNVLLYDGMRVWYIIMVNLVKASPIFGKIWSFHWPVYIIISNRIWLIGFNVITT